MEDSFYIFTSRSIQESIYNLMLREIREHVHYVIATILHTKSQLDSTDRLYEIIHHYILSDNLSKKIEYLEYAAKRAELSNQFHDMYNYYHQLIQLATGMDIKKLLCTCIKPYTLTIKKHNMNSNNLQYTAFTNKVIMGESSHGGHTPTDTIPGGMAELTGGKIPSHSVVRTPTRNNNTPTCGGNTPGKNLYGGMTPFPNMHYIIDNMTVKWAYANDMKKKITIDKTNIPDDCISLLNSECVSVWLGQMGIAQGM